MLPATLRKKDLPIVPEMILPTAGIQKSRSRQKIRSKSKGITQTGYGQSYQLSKKNQSIKAYHFSNSIYHGEVRAFHRVGKGMIIHDNGLTGIIRSGTNRLKEHNVFFGQNIIISVIYKERELDFVYKNGNRILVLNMQKKGEDITLNSIGYLVQLDYQRVSKLKFKSDVLVQKVVLTRQQTDEIINQQKFEKIMRQQHIQALKFNLFDPSFSNIEIMPKFRNEVYIGFTSTKPNHYSTTYELSFQQKDYHNRNLQGLGMILQKISHDSNKQFRYETRILQRGFYSNGRLQYFGQLFYLNGNHYFGGIKDQEIHGNGILIYPNQNRFVIGKFNQGKPLYLDQSPSYRLDTEDGRNLHASFRKKIHSEDPEVWIDCEVLDLPDLEYFRQKLDQCSHFNYQDQQVRNYLKNEEDLRLSRKVQDFQKDGRSSRQISDRRSNTMSFGQKDGLSKSSIPQIPNFLQNRDLATQINRQVEQQSLKHAIGSQLINNQSLPLFPLGLYNNSNPPTIESPIQRIQSDKLQLNNSASNNSQINQSIVQRFNFDGAHSSSNNVNSRSVNQSENGKKSFPENKNPFSLEGKNQNISKRQNSPTPVYNISVRSPIEGSRVSQDSIPRSIQKSASRSLSRGRSRSNGKRRNLFQQSEEFIKTFQRSPQTNQKRSIMDRLYGQENIRAQILQKEYQMLQKDDKARYLPDRLVTKKVSPGRVITKASQSPGKTYDYTGYGDEPNEMDVKIMMASNEALRLAHSNKVKQEKYQQYEHMYTHKKRFDYTSQSYDQRGGRPYSNINVLSKQTHFERTPQKVSKYDTYDSNQANRTSKKEMIDGLVNRLYPKHVTQEYVKRPQQMYDSRYQQEQPLNKYGTVRGDDKRMRQEESVGRFSYGKDFKGSVLKNNVIVRS